MAREPHVALFKTVPGSLARRQILAACFKALQNSEYFKKGLPKLSSVVFSCLIVQLAKLVLNYKILWSRVTPMLNCMALMETHF